MAQPASSATPLRPLFKLGDEEIASDAHVIVYANDADKIAASILSLAFAQTHPHRDAIQLQTEDAYLIRRAHHASPQNDGSSCRVPLIIGECANLSATQKQIASTSSTSTAASEFRVHTLDFSNPTYQTVSQCVHDMTQTALQLSSSVVPSTSAVNSNLSTLAGVLWFAKEILSCDLDALLASAVSSTSSNSLVHASQRQQRASSPPPNTQLNIVRMNVAHPLPSTLAADSTLPQIAAYVDQLALLVNAENATIEMQVQPTATMDLLAVPSSSSSSSSSSSYTPSPSPDAANISSSSESPVPAKHTPLQPLASSVPHTQKPMLACDLDEVLGEFVPPMIRFHNATYGTNLKLSDFHSYHFSNVWGGTNEEAQEKIAKFYLSDEFKNMPVVDGAFQVLTKLKERFDITVVTSRQHAIEAATRAWLDRHYPGIFCGVLFGNHYASAGRVQTKEAMCQHIKAVAIIDDSLIYAQQCSPVLERVFLFDRDLTYRWNHTDDSTLPKNVMRCRSWQQIEQELVNWTPTGVVAQSKGAQEPE